MICPGCGGIVGRDCWNPQECEAITRDMAQRYQDGRAEDDWAYREALADQERAYYREQEQAFEAERFEATGMGLS